MRKIFRGKNIVFTLLFFLVFLIYSNIQSEETHISQVPSVAGEPSQEEDIIEEHEPEDASISAEAVEGISTERQTAQVVKVVDGDTIAVSLNGTSEKIRVIGLNTPETVDPRRGVQCFGREASNFAKQTLLGKTVQLESDPTQAERDKYGRLLRFVFMENGVDFGQYMIQEGYGHEYTYESPYKYQVAYKQAENEARDAGKGLWSAGCN